jgi:hypothetical protein
MKQIVIRILGPQIPVFDVLSGNIKDGQFAPDASVETTLKDLLGGDAAALVRFDSMLGGQAFIASDNLRPFVDSLTSNVYCTSMEYYPNFLIFKFDCYGTEKEEK